jgi:1,2-phenylacetyl-CoA epoxidase catalytic subunit
VTAAASNLLLAERNPMAKAADTTARQFYFDVWHELLLRNLAVSCDPRIAEDRDPLLPRNDVSAEHGAAPRW